MNIIQNFKLLTTSSKRLLMAGTLIGFLVALPLFLYVVLNVNFEIRNKAASNDPVSGEITPTPTIVPSLDPKEKPVANGAMIQDGSFEINLDADKIPDLWIWGKTLMPSADEGITCDTNHLDGNCSLALKGGIFQKVVKQKIGYQVSGINVFSFDAWSKSQNAVGPGQYRIVLEFENDKEKVVARRVYLFSRGTHDFQRISKEGDIFKLNKNIKAVTVSLIFTKPFGKVWFDNLILKNLSEAGYESIPEASDNLQDSPVQFVNDLY